MLISGALGREKSSENHELLSKDISRGPRLPGLYPGPVNRSLLRKAAQNGLFIMKNHSATHSRDDLPGGQDVILFTTVKLQLVPQLTLQHVPPPLRDLCCESRLSLTPGSGHASIPGFPCHILRHPCSWAPGPHISFQAAPATPVFGLSLFFFLSLGWEKVTMDAAFAREFPDSAN